MNSSSPNPPTEDTREMLTKLTMAVWGPFGSNGLSGDSKRHSKEIGELYGRDEALRQDVDNRINGVTERLNAKLDGLYKLMTTLIVTILVGAGGIVATLLVTAK